MAVLERFLRYGRIDTRADDRSAACPSTPGQMTLQRMLERELREIGLVDVELDANGYLMATVPATVDAPVPVIGLVAHVDTSPEMPGADVTPIVHARWDGGDIVLPDDPSAVLRASEHPELAAQIGHDIVTASGLTLLGADDKAGVAVAVEAAAQLTAQPGIPHGRIRLCFTPDEEIGRGADRFDVARFGASCAYTLDGGALGELEFESFSADLMTVRFTGFNTHPGYARGKMVNAIKAAARFVDRLPADRLSPETTDGYDGFVHPYQLETSVDRTIVRVLLRDFATDRLREHQRLVESLARLAAAEHARSPRPASGGGRARARGHPARGPDADREADPRRDGRLAPVVHGSAHAEPLRRRAQLSFTPGVDVAAGPRGCSARRHRARARVGPLSRIPHP
jgi:tripeptide aminopeptidase